MLPVVIFEGVDKSGKSTLLQAFNKATDYKYLVLDRFLISSLVYDEAFERGRREYYSKLCGEFGKLENVAFLVVYCTSLNRKVVQERLDNAGEVLPEQLRNIKRIDLKFWGEIVSQCYKCCAGHPDGGLVKDFIILDTSSLTIEKCVEEIKEFVESFE